MLRVYLDQNKWVDLALAATGNPRGARYRDVHARAMSGAFERIASFPLSSVHISETCRIRNPKRRCDLAAVMIRLSRRHTITALNRVFQGEIEQALHRLSGRPGAPPEIEPFGIGLPFACGGATDHASRDGESIDIDDAMAEFYALAVGDATPENQRSSAARHGAGVEFSKLEERWRSQLSAGRKRFGEGRAIVTVANSLIEKEVIGLGMLHGVPVSAFEALTSEGWVEFVSGMPTVWCLSNLILLKQANPEHRWDSNDLNDLKALSVASVYCDVVVAEKAWIAYLRRIGAGARFGTTFVTDLSMLADLLAA